MTLKIVKQLRKLLKQKLLLWKDLWSSQTSSNMIKRKRRQVTNIMNKIGSITTDPANMNRIFREFCEQFYKHKFDHSSEMDQLVKTHKLPNSPDMKQVFKKPFFFSPMTIKDISFTILKFLKPCYAVQFILYTVWVLWDFATLN